MASEKKKMEERKKSFSYRKKFPKRWWKRFPYLPVHLPRALASSFSIIFPLAERERVQKKIKIYFKDTSESIFIFERLTGAEKGFAKLIQQRFTARGDEESIQNFCIF